MPRSSRRASKRPRQLSPRQVRRPRVRRQQLKQPVRLRQQLKRPVRPPQRNLPLTRRPLPAGQPNLLLRPRQLPKLSAFLFARSSPEILREKTFAVRMRGRARLERRLAREIPLAKTHLVLRLAVGDSRSTAARSTITGVDGTFVPLFKSASLDARIRI